MTTSDDLLGRLFQLTVAMSDAMAEDLAARGLTRARATLMAHLHREGPTVQRALARALRVSPRNVTGLVNGLEASGLVQRSPHPTDGRATVVTLTGGGSRAAAALAHDQREFARYLFRGRTTTELHGLAVELDRMLARLEQPDFEALRRAALRRWPLPEGTSALPTH